MPYIYETHMHTSPASACASTWGGDYIRSYRDAGYAGIIITDHFYHGNCGIDRQLPWKEFIHRFCSGYEAARNEGERLNFPVFFGWEENFDGDEYLIYGLDGEWMMEHPEMRNWTRKDQYDAVHAAGGCVVQAHPFRARSYIQTIYLSPELVDGVEGCNANNEPAWNTLAMRYARVTGLPVTAGSDTHHVEEMSRENLAGVMFDEPLHSIEDYTRAILNREHIGLYLPRPVPEWTEDVYPEKPTIWLGADGRPTEKNVMEILRRESSKG